MEDYIKKERKVDRAIERSVLIFIFFLPFFTPLAYLAMIIALVYWLHKVKLRGFLGVKPKIFGVALLGLTFAILLSVIFSVDKLFSLGCFGLYLFYPFICLLMIDSVGNSVRVEKILQVIILSGIVVAGFGIIQFLTKFEFEFHKYFLNISMATKGGVTSTWGNPNRFAKYLDLVLPLSFVYLLIQKSMKKKVLPAIFIGLGLVCLPLTKSLGGMMAVFAVLVILFAIKNWKLCLIFLLILLLFVLFNFDWLISIANRYGNMEQRLYTWENIVFPIIKDYPITGSGLGTYVKISPEYPQTIRAAHSHAHSIYFNYLSELGILGFGMLLWVIMIFFRNSINYLRKHSFFVANGLVAGCLLSIFSAMIHGVVETFVDYFQLGLLFWLIIGLGLGMMRFYTSSKKTPAEEKS
ncbi:MAG: O-antigen ligase family protein [Candidatus Aerophobetes bacterium]|nr:O-antigen ligase family protein [Candidatus Aerophobetes bacterium]